MNVGPDATLVESSPHANPTTATTIDATMESARLDIGDLLSKGTVPRNGCQNMAASKGCPATRRWYTVGVLRAHARVRTFSRRLAYLWRLLHMTDRRHELLLRFARVCPI